MSSSDALALALAVLTLTGACGRDREVSPGAADGEEAAPPRRQRTSPGDVLRSCTDKPIVRQSVMSTEGGCHGFVQWNVVQGFQLDVVRYGTIVEIEVTGSEPAALDVQAGPHVRVNTRRVTAVIRAVLKGRLGGTGRGAKVEFVVADTHAWPITEMKSPLLGAVFLPPAHITDPSYLGCLEGHFLVYDRNDRGGEIQRIAALADAGGPDGVLDPKSAWALANGGSTRSGMFLSEYAPTDVAMALVVDPTVLPLPDFQWGMVTGLVRMRDLMAVADYPRRWTEEELRKVMWRMGRWAVAALLLPDAPDEASVWLFEASTILSGVHELEIPEPTRSLLAHSQPILANWLQGGSGRGERLAPVWLLQRLSRRSVCDNEGSPSPSHVFAYRGY